MANWSNFLNQTLKRVSGKSQTPALPRLSAPTSKESENPLAEGKIALYDGKDTKGAKQIRESLSYQLFEKMRRRALNWKSYYYYDQYEIPRLAIANHNATGIHINDRRYFISYDRVVALNLYTNRGASTIYLDVNDLQNISQELFDRLKNRQFTFQVHKKSYPLQINFGNERQKINNQLYSFGKHQIYLSDNNSCYLLRSFRNLGADGFTALSNHLLAQAGLSLDPKNAIEALLLELGNDELLQHYQSALNSYNQQSSFRNYFGGGGSAAQTAPLVITKAQGKSGRQKNQKQDLSVSVRAVSDEAYEQTALLLDGHFSEIEEELLRLSVASLSLDRTAVLEGCSALKEKLHGMAEIGVFEVSGLGELNELIEQMVEERELAATAKSDYSPLEDQAYEEIFMELLGKLQEITTDYRYQNYPPIRSQIDKLMETVQVLGNALENANEKKRRREINDRREILTHVAFALPSASNNSPEDQPEQLSYYDKLLQVQKEIAEITPQMSYAIYDVSFELARIAFIIAQLNRKKFPQLKDLSEKLITMIGAEKRAISQSEEQKFADKLVPIGAELKKVVSDEMSNRLQKSIESLSKFRKDRKLYDKQNWTAEYLEFASEKLRSFREDIFQVATDSLAQILELLDAQIYLVETFINGVSVPALLPAQLHESGSGLQTFLVKELQKYLNSKNLQLHTVPGREQELRSLLDELMPRPLESQLEQLEYFFSQRA